jgi:hypothetical protein
MTKVIPQIISQNLLDVSELLYAVHSFLEAAPPSDWKRRAAEKVIPQADMPLRTVKTILHEIVNVMGESIYNYLGLIPDVQRSHAVVYIRQMVEQEKKKSMGSEESLASSDVGESNENLHQRDQAKLFQPSVQRPMSMPPTSSLAQTTPLAGMVGSDESHKFNQKPRPVSTLPSVTEVDARLTVIFARIGQKDETKQGIADLYEFRKRHPEWEERVQAHLGKTGNYFQGYIKRGLAALESEEAAASGGAAPSSSLGVSAANSVASGLSSRYSPENNGLSSSNGNVSPSSPGASLSAISTTLGGSGRIPSVGAALNGHLSNSKTSLSASASHDSVDAYKETLSRLQQRLGFSSVTNESSTISSSSTAYSSPSSPVQITSSISSTLPRGLTTSSTTSSISAAAAAPSITTSTFGNLRNSSSSSSFSSSSSTSPTPDSHMGQPPSSSMAAAQYLQQHKGLVASSLSSAAPQAPPPTQTVEQLKQRLARMKVRCHICEFYQDFDL